MNLQRKKIVLAFMIGVNVVLSAMTVQSAQNGSVNQASLETTFGAKPQVVEAKIQPLKQPVAIVSSIGAEKVEPTPTPQAAVASVSISRASNVGNWDGLLQQYFGEAWVAAKAVMNCESGGNASAVGPLNPGNTRPYGLMQIMALPGRPSIESLLNPEINISYAANIYHAQGWGPWSCKSVLGR